jgi:phosphohistidine phosphatase
MKLLILRHAIAVDPGTPGIEDDERPLTPRGRKRFAKAALGLARIVSVPDALLTSPLPRALETAQIAAEAWGDVTPIEEPRLAAGHAEELLPVLAGHGDDALVALVGHEPHVSHLLGRIVGGTGERLAFKKGGAALVEMDAATPGSGRLIWFLPPRLLRRLGGD